MCNDEFLFFFHFSAYKPENPNKISIHQNRLILKDLKGLHELFLTYTNLLKKNGYDTTKQWPYGYKHYFDGRIIKRIGKKFYRKIIKVINNYYRKIK